MVLALNCNLTTFDHKSFPLFAQPNEIGNISSDKERRLEFDKSQLKILNLSSTTVNSCAVIQFDLNRSYDKFVEKAGGERIDNLLKWILFQTNPKDRVNLKQSLFNTDFVCWRGLFTKVAATLYQPRESWIVCVTKFKGIYFLCEFDTLQKKLYYENRTDRELLMTYWGHSFEKFVTSPKNVQQSRCNDDDGAVNCYEEFSSIVRSKLADHRLIFGAEIDCVDPLNGKYIELKTSRVIETQRQYDNFKRKLVKWWIQSFLIGIEEIIYGLRNDDGVVSKLERISLSDIRKMCEQFWSASICFNFLQEFLSVVKNFVDLDNPTAVYKFEYIPSQKRVIFERDLALEHSILPEWFLAEF